MSFPFLGGLVEYSLPHPLRQLREGLLKLEEWGGSVSDALCPLLDLPVEEPFAFARSADSTRMASADVLLAVLQLGKGRPSEGFTMR